MISHAKLDLVQDITSDCSVVASLCAGTARVERGYAKVRAMCWKTKLINDLAEFYQSRSSPP